MSRIYELTLTTLYNPGMVNDECASYWPSLSFVPAISWKEEVMMKSANQRSCCQWALCCLKVQKRLKDLHQSFAAYGWEVSIAGRAQCCTWRWLASTLPAVFIAIRSAVNWHEKLYSSISFLQQAVSRKWMGIVMHYISELFLTFWIWLWPFWWGFRFHMLHFAPIFFSKIYPEPEKVQLRKAKLTSSHLLLCTLTAYTQAIC